MNSAALFRGGMMPLVPFYFQSYVAQKRNRTWATTLMTVIKKSCCCNCSALSGGRNPGTLDLHGLFTVESLSIHCFWAQSKLWEKNPKGFAEFGIGHIVYFTHTFDLQTEIVAGSQKTVHNAEEDLKTKGRRVMIRGKDCTLHNLLQVYNYLLLGLGVQTALITTIQQYNS